MAGRSGPRLGPSIPFDLHVHDVTPPPRPPPTTTNDIWYTKVVLYAFSFFFLLGCLLEEVKRIMSRCPFPLAPQYLV